MRLEETVETLAKQHIQLERACEIEKVKDFHHQKSNISSDSPTIKTFEKNILEDDESDEDLFEDAMSDFPEQFPGHKSPDKEHLNPYQDFEDSSPNDDSSVNSSELSLQNAVEESQPIDIKRSTSEQILNIRKEENHKRWMLDEVDDGGFGQVR